MRRAALAICLLPLAGCPDEGPRGLGVTINRVLLEIDRASPDALAELELNIELVAQRQGATASVEEVTAFTLPDGDMEFSFSPQLIGRVGEVSSVTLENGETLGVRVLNASVTNASLMGVCGRPMELTVVFDDDGRLPEDTDTVTPACRN